MPSDPSAFFSPSFVSQFETALLALPGDHHHVTWANGEAGVVAALVGPPRGSFVVGQEEGLVLLIDKRTGQKIEAGAVGQVTGSMVVQLIQDQLAKRQAADQTPPAHTRSS